MVRLDFLPGPIILTSFSSGNTYYGAPIKVIVEEEAEIKVKIENEEEIKVKVEID